MNKKNIVEGLKSGLRVAVFAFVGYLVSYVSSLPQDSTTLIVLIVLKVVDKAIHDSDLKLNGLFPL